MRAALDAEVELVAEPLAVVRRYEIERGLLDDGALVVYDLGASGLTVSVVRTGEQAGLLGTPARSDAISGAEFDLLTMRYVLSHALGDREFDPFDPAVEAELALLRERCRVAKEELSLDTATAVPAGALGGPVRIVRGELEELVRQDVRDSLELVRTAVRQAGIEFGDVRAVLLTGGGGAIPLVAELLSAEFGLPVVTCADPATASAAGAAELAADLLAAESPAQVAVGAMAYSDYHPEEGVRLFDGSPLAGVVTGESGVVTGSAGTSVRDSETATPRGDYPTIGTSDDERSLAVSPLSESGPAVGIGASGVGAAARIYGRPGNGAGRAGLRSGLLSVGGSAEKDPAVSLFAANRIGEASLPEVDDRRSPKLVSRKRLAVVAAAVAAFGALTAGTLAVAPQFTTPSSTAAEATTSTGAPARNVVTPIAAVDANGNQVVGTPTLDASGNPVPGAPLLDTTGQPIPGTVTPGTTQSAAPGTTQNATQPTATDVSGGAQGGSPQGETPQTEAGAPQSPPAQEQPPNGAPAPENTPQPQQPSPAPVESPSPTTPPTTTKPSPAPPQPQYPNLGQIPGKIIDGAGEVVDGTVDGVTELPGELLGGGN
ncbi:Hsp70 family protein [Nocardia sp. NPDC059177]|uniref:Hsp70 family protein n=1 Tax=Nocardia sp. NPDC059177 TaxID=3346759 RepID=UPI0036ADBD08